MVDVLRSTSSETFQQGKHNKLHFFKMPSSTAPAGLGNDGYYLFNTVTKGGDIMIVGDSVRDIERWISGREGHQGFSNRMYDTTRDALGHDAQWEAGFTPTNAFGGDTIRATGGAVLGARGAFDGPSVCPVCGKKLPETLPANKRKGKKSFRYARKWYCSEQCAMTVQFHSLTALKAGAEARARNPLDANRRPAPEDTSEVTVSRTIYLMPQILSRESTIATLSPVGDAAIQLAGGAAGLAPGGSSCVVGNIMLDLVNGANDAQDQINTYIATKGPAVDLNLRPCLTVSITGGRGAIDMGDGTGHDGILTFGELREHNGYHAAVSALNTMWQSAIGG